MIEVEGPDGSIIEFPDGTPDDVIKGVMQRQFGAPQQPQAAPAQPPQMPPQPQPPANQRPAPVDWDAAGRRLREAWGGFKRGVADIVEGHAQLVHETQKLRGFDSDTAGKQIGIPTTVNQEIRQNEDDYLAAYHGGVKPEFDAPRLIGNVAATLPYVMAVPQGGGFLTATLTGGAQGALGGGLQPVSPDGKDFWKEKGRQTQTGAAFGAGGGALVNRLSAMIKPNISDDVGVLMDRGVTPTPGQVLGGAFKTTEEKLTSVPILGDVIKGGQRRAIEQFNTAVYDDVLRPIGGTAPKSVGRQAVAEVGDTLSQAYDDLLPKIGFRADPQFSSELANLRSLVSGLPEQNARTFERFVNDKIAKALGPNGRMDGRTFKEIESVLSKEIGTFGRSTDAYQQQLADAFRTLQQSLRDGLSRSNQGVAVNVNGRAVDAAQRLADINLGWAKLARLEKAAGMQGAAEGVFTPAQLSSAVKTADKSVRNRAFARGDALLQDLSDPAKNVIGNVYPDSGTAGRVAAMLATGGMGYVSPPAAVAAGAAMLPYTGLGQRVTANILANRPVGADRLALHVRDLGPLAAALLAQQAR